MVEFTDEQNQAMDLVDRFFRNSNPHRPYFDLKGLAGTGKTTVLAEMAHRYKGAVLCAPTGKAASVLSRKTGLQTSTCHSAIYNFRGQYVADDGEKYLSFSQKIDDNAWQKKFALLDESSNVPIDIAEDLLATGARVVASGDPGQLPPVRGVAFFNTADFTLQTIHRQALESPIIRQAHSVRSYGQYKADGDDFRVTNFITADDILQADVILCWKNATRMALNKLVRAHKGISGLPRRGEPIMCLRNDRRMGVLNGATYELLNDYSSNDAEVRLVNERGDVVTVENSWFEVFDAPPDEEDEQEAHPFTLAYAATVHKFQGSEVQRGILVDEYNRSDWRREWLYTGITRFAKSVIIHREG